MPAVTEPVERLEQKLDTIIDLLKHIVVLQLADKKVSHQAIGKQVHLAKATIGQMLKGIKVDG